MNQPITRPIDTPMVTFFVCRNRRPASERCTFRRLMAESEAMSVAYHCVIGQQGPNGITTLWLYVQVQRGAGAHCLASVSACCLALSLVSRHLALCSQATRRLNRQRCHKLRT